MQVKTKIILSIIALLIGASGGFLYYKWIGCNGTCAIWSSPWKSMAYGSILAALLAYAFMPEKKKNSTE